MLVLKERIIETPIMSLQTGSQIAVTAEPIIDPRELKIIAFYCQGPHLDSTPAVLHVDDIREISKLGFIVDGAEALMPPDGLIRLQRVINFHFKLEGKMAVEENGRKIGKISTYTLDTNSFYITTLHAQPTIWQSWNTAEILIGRNQIIEITDTKIITRSATAQDTVKATPARNQNPFRSRPQAEVTRSIHE